MANKDLTGHVLDCISFLCITSDEFLKLARSALNTKILPSEPVIEIVNACYKFFDSTKSAPKDHICDVLDDTTKHFDVKKRTLIFNYLDRVSQLKPPNIDYIVQTLSHFISTREFELAALEFVRCLDRGEIEEAKHLMSQALRKGIEKEELGIDYINDTTTLLPQEHHFLMPTGIELIDRYRQTFMRGRFVGVIAGAKGKKSWSMTHFGKLGLIAGLNVLHVSHENSRDECAERYDRCLGGLVDRFNHKKEVPLYKWDPSSRSVKKEMVVRPSILDTSARRAARRTIKRFGGRLWIVKFPMGSASIFDMENLYDRLEAQEGFLPDVIINDYPDIMRPADAKKATRDNINDIYIAHKRWADERQCLVLAPSQTTRASLQSKYVGIKDAAEDYRKAANVDAMLSISQTMLQSQSSIATVRVIAARTGKQDISAGIVLNLDVGQFYTESFPVFEDEVSVDGEED